MGRNRIAIGASLGKNAMDAKARCARTASPVGKDTFPPGMAFGAATNTTGTRIRSMRKLWATIVGLGASLAAIESLAAGALAIDQGNGSGYGWAVDHESQAEADARALRECGQGCSIVGRFNDSCMAHAADQAPGSTSYGYAHALTGQEARTSALQFCSHYGGADSQCVIRVWGCDSEDPAETPEEAVPDPSAAESPTQTRLQWSTRASAGFATATLPAGPGCAGVVSRCVHVGWATVRHMAMRSMTFRLSLLRSAIPPAADRTNVYEEPACELLHGAAIARDGPMSRFVCRVLCADREVHS